jgi:hypothetical protein
MKLTAPMVRQTLDQFEAQPIPDNNPAVPELNRLFGDHTFFLDRNGLNIVEPTAADSGGAPEWQVVKLATWKDETRTSLMPHDPEPTDRVIALDSEEPDSVA